MDPWIYGSAEGPAARPAAGAAAGYIYYVIIDPKGGAKRPHICT